MAFGVQELKHRIALPAAGRAPATATDRRSVGANGGGDADPEAAAAARRNGAAPAGGSPSVVTLAGLAG